MRLQIRHIGTFSLLLCLATVRPDFVFPNTGLPVGPLVLLFGFAALLWKVIATIGFGEFVQRNKTLLILVFSYQFLCLISLAVNYSRYDDYYNLARWGFTFIAAQTLLPICVLIFSLPQHHHRLSLTTSAAGGWILAALGLIIPLMAFLQAFSPLLSIKLLSPFVASAIPIIPGYDVRGIFAAPTDLGAISGAISWTLGVCAFFTRSSNPLLAIFMAVLALLNFGAGLLSDSRNFILFNLVVFAAMTTLHLWSASKLKAICTGLLIIPLFYLSMLVLPNGLLIGIGKFIPAFEKSAMNEAIQLSDLIPAISVTSLDERGRLWVTAWELVEKNPIIGISNGGFRLLNNSLPIHNTHNLFLQSLIDAGVAGFTVICIGLLAIIKSAKGNTPLLAFVFGIIATLQVDNFIDHSYAWVIIITFCFSIMTTYYSNERPNDNFQLT